MSRNWESNYSNREVLLPARAMNPWVWTISALWLCSQQSRKTFSICNSLRYTSSLMVLVASVPSAIKLATTETQNKTNMRASYPQGLLSVEWDECSNILVVQWAHNRRALHNCDLQWRGSSLNTRLLFLHGHKKNRVQRFCRMKRSKLHRWRVLMEAQSSFHVDGAACCSVAGVEL